MTNHDDNRHFTTTTAAAAADLRLSSSSSPGLEIFPPFDYQITAGPRKKPRKKRTKLINPSGVGSSSIVSSGDIVLAKPKSGKKPDPSAPKITRPCSECGKKFWSWKALFGHMRCHPERQWRGINPPPNFRRWPTTMASAAAAAAEEEEEEVGMTEEDHEVAACLLMLVNSPPPPPSAFSNTQVITTARTMDHGLLESENVFKDGNCRFECSSCKKVFGSHQALGGHRASHKNVKGCFAITKTCTTDSDELLGLDHNGHSGDVSIIREDEKMMMVFGGHRCSICLRVFSSGQALGGHKRCHWERGDEPEPLSLTLQGLNTFATRREGGGGGGGGGSGGLDLNLPAPVEGDSLSCYSSGLALDLRLGL